MHSNTNQTGPITHSPAMQTLSLLARFSRWWMIPTIACTLAAVIFALFTTKNFTSRQTLVVRDDLVGTFFKPGRFDSLDSMKSAQETILEIARRPHVVRSALERLGPPRGKSASRWLNEVTIEKMQGKIHIGAPNGAEFGKTEAIVLSVEAESRRRSKEMIGILLDEIEASLRTFRRQQFQSMQKELFEAARVADESFQRTADSLKRIEQQAGPDLSTLISLNDAQAGTNNLQSELATLTAEQRQAKTEVETVRKQIQILQDVDRNPEVLLEVPTELLQLQPTLDSLAKGLNAALLRYSINVGKYTQSHPKVQESALAVEDVKKQINDKLAGALVSLQHQLELRQDNFDRKSSLIEEKRRRLSELSEIRVPYFSLLAEVEKKAEMNGKAQANLSEILSLGAAADQVDLITRVDEPQVGIYPNGPSNKIVVIGGMLGGLFIGLGLVMFVAPIDLNLVLNPMAMTAPKMDRADPVEGDSDPRESRPKTAGDGPPPGPQSTVLKKSKPKSISEAIAEHNRSDDLNSGPTDKVQPPSEIGCDSTTAADRLTNRTDEIKSIELPNVEDFWPTDNSSFQSANTPLKPLGAGLIAKARKSTAMFPPPVDTGQELDVLDSQPVNLDALEDAPDALEIRQGNSWDAPRYAMPGANTMPAPIPGLRNESIAEKIRQLEQQESGNVSTTQFESSPILRNVSGKGESPPNPATGPGTPIGLPLNTSNQNSSTVSTDGDESAPHSGDEPEIRPTASTVDLRRLKDQLAGKTPPAQPPIQKKLGEILAQRDQPIDDLNVQKRIVVDQNIADLASSIRDMCRSKPSGDSDASSPQ